MIAVPGMTRVPATAVVSMPAVVHRSMPARMRRVLAVPTSGVNIVSSVVAVFSPVAVCCGRGSGRRVGA